jgi:hypothetical protein
MLDFRLVAALFAFVAVMAVVLGFCFRERHLWHDGRTGANLRGTPTAEHASDGRIAAVIFGAIFVGALLALLVAYLVFFSGLAKD